MFSFLLSNGSSFSVCTYTTSYEINWTSRIQTKHVVVPLSINMMTDDLVKGM